MTSPRQTQSVSVAHLAGLCIAAVLAWVTPAHAGNANAVLTLTAVPTVASVSRDANTPVPAADFRAAYRVSIFNPSNSSKNFRFVGNVTVEGTGSTPPTQFVSSRRDCSLTGTDPVQVVCRKLEVAKGATIVFQLEFRTPTVGTKMNLLASLFFPASNGTLTAYEEASTQLVKLDYGDYTLGFNTFVPRTGGTFFSGAASTLAGSPGGVATQADPFTTTIIVPQIAFTTTALVEEKQRGELSGCASIFVNQGCFESDLTIPSNPGALAGLIIYLRIDQSKLAPTPGSFAVRIGYSKSGEIPVAVPDCSATVVATSGKPCIRERKFYSAANTPPDWLGDLEVKIEAVDNGRYVNL